MSDHLQWDDMPEGTRMNGPTRPAVPREPVRVSQYTAAGRAIAALALLSFGIGTGYAIIDLDWRWMALGILAFIVFGGISSMFRKGE